MGASSDRYALAIGNRRGTFQNIVGNVEAEDIGFGLTGYVAVHDTRPIEALTGKPNRYRAIECAAVPCVTVRVSNIEAAQMAGYTVESTLLIPQRPGVVACLRQ